MSHELWESILGWRIAQSAEFYVSNYILGAFWTQSPLSIEKKTSERISKWWNLSVFLGYRVIGLF